MRDSFGYLSFFTFRHENLRTPPHKKLWRVIQKKKKRNVNEWCYRHIFYDNVCPQTAWPANDLLKWVRRFESSAVTVLTWRQASFIYSPYLTNVLVVRRFTAVDMVNEAVWIWTRELVEEDPNGPCYCCSVDDGFHFVTQLLGQFWCYRYVTKIVIFVTFRPLM